jgi:hypothetical protein
MDFNIEIKKLKKDFVIELGSELLKGKLDKTSGIVLVVGLAILEMADAYTTVNPMEIPPLDKQTRIRLHQAKLQWRRRRRRLLKLKGLKGN